MLGEMSAPVGSVMRTLMIGGVRSNDGGSDGGEEYWRRDARSLLDGVVSANTCAISMTDRKAWYATNSILIQEHLSLLGILRDGK